MKRDTTLIGLLILFILKSHLNVSQQNNSWSSLEMESCVIPGCNIFLHRSSN